MRMELPLGDMPIRAALACLGMTPADLDDQTARQIDAAQRSIEAAGILPAAVMRRFSLGEDGVFCGTAFRPGGQDVRALLGGCSGVIVMAATLGAASERLLYQASAVDPVRAMLIDAILSAMIEQATDTAAKRIESELAQQGLHVTDRFSPGYGDMPLSDSIALIDLLGAGRDPGITVSQSGIMIPRKSITAVIGISEEIQARKRNKCDACPQRERCPACAAGRRGGAPDDGWRCSGGIDDV